MVRQESKESIGDLDITLTIEGDDELLANLVYADIYGRLDELKQMVDEDIPLEGTVKPVTADWEAYLNDELPREDDNE